MPLKLQQVVELLDRHDLEALCRAGAPAGEYEIEAQMIVSRLGPNRWNTEQAALLCLLGAFASGLGPRDDINGEIVSFKYEVPECEMPQWKACAAELFWMAQQP